MDWFYAGVNVHVVYLKVKEYIDLKNCNIKKRISLYIPCFFDLSSIHLNKTNFVYVQRILNAETRCGVRSAIIPGPCSWLKLFIHLAVYVFLSQGLLNIAHHCRSVLFLYTSILCLYYRYLTFQTDAAISLFSNDCSFCFSFFTDCNLRLEFHLPKRFGREKRKKMLYMHLIDWLELVPVIL